MIKEIEKLVLRGKNNFSLWHNDKIKEVYYYLMKNYINKGKNSLKLNGKIYILIFTKGRNGRGGMDDGSPDTITLEELK